MANTYILAEAISKINNAQKKKKQYIVIKYSKMTIAIFKLMLKLGYVEKIKEKETEKNIRKIKIYLKYGGEFNESTIKEFSLISKPGKRIYVGYRNIKRFYGGLGTIIMSSSKGIITDYYAIDNKVGGELLCKII